MKNKNASPSQFILVILLVLLPIALIAFGFWQSNLTATAKIADDTFTYLPIIKNPPAPTPIPPVPQFLKNIPLPNAQCPNSVGFNAISGYVYIANNFSKNVSAFKDTNFVTDIPMGTWPTLIAADNDSALTYVTVLQDQVTILDGTTIVGKIPDKYEPYGVVVNPVNGNTYISDLDSTVQIANGTSLITNVNIKNPNIPPPNNDAGWLEPIIVDPTTGLVYVASWSHGMMYVMNGTSVVASYRAGWGIKNMAIDASRGYIYLAHSEPNATYPHNISVFNIATQQFTYITTAPGNHDDTWDVVVDPNTGYAYFTNPNLDTVTVMEGTQVVANLPVGDRPWGIGVNPNTGYVFVANRASNTITVIKELAVVNTISAQGLQPFAVGVDTINNDVYIANRGNEYDLFKCHSASVTVLR